ncbi:MAG: PDR/VanB family oxidoreductase [Pseudomonadota bacterium]
MTAIQATVAHKERCARDVYALTLSVPPSAAPVTPGAHIDVSLPGGLMRQYSVFDAAPDRRTLKIAVLREEEGRGGSKALCDDVYVGQTLTVSAPRNHFELVLDQKHYVLIGGGIGITPLFAMAHALASRAASFELHYCARARGDAALCEEIEVSPWAPRAHFYFSEEGPSPRLDLPSLMRELRADASVYICGPERMLLESQDLAAALQWPAGKLRFESFSPVQAAVPRADTAAFRVRLSQSGEEFDVAADQTLLEALTGQGVDVPTSCTEGVCGSCITPVISGEIDHHDCCLYDEEKEANTAIAVCVSRGKTGGLLVLDL